MTPRAPDAIRAEMVDAAERLRRLQAELAGSLNKHADDRAYRWKGAPLEALRVDFEGLPESISLRAIGKLHDTSAGCIVRLARQHGWTRGGNAKGAEHG